MTATYSTNYLALCFRRGHSHWTRKQSIISRIRLRTALEFVDSSSPPTPAEEDPLYKPPSKTMSKRSIKPASKRKGAVPLKISKQKDSDSNFDIEVSTQKSNDSAESKTSDKTPKKELVPKSEVSLEKPKETKQDRVDLKGQYRKLKNGGFGCKICNERFTHRFKVCSHIRAKHQPREIFYCPECPQSYKSKYQLKMHMNIHRENKSDYMFFCDKCDYRALAKHYLKNHEIRKHSNEYPFECDHCKKRFKIKMDLKFHLGTHSDSQHMCDVCGKMYTSPESLYKHRRVMHFNEYKFKCPKCWQKLISQESLDNHLESHKVLHSCDECDLKFTKKYYVTRHKKRVHMVEKNKLCPVCGKRFLCMATLRVHYLTHAKVKPYLCNVCGFSFTQRSSMMLHWKRKHPDAEAPPPPVILTNFFDSINSEVQKLVEPTIESPPSGLSLLGPSKIAASESCQTTKTVSSNSASNVDSDV